MTQARITFSNNETLIVKEGDTFVPISKIIDENEVTSAMSKPYELWSHHHDGLIPSLTEMLFNGHYFFKVGNQNVIYNTSAIVKIENL